MTEQQVRELVKDLDFALDFTEPLAVILKRFEDILRPHFQAADTGEATPAPLVLDLVKKWRKRSVDLRTIWTEQPSKLVAEAEAYQLDVCANELEAALHAFPSLPSAAEKEHK